uniref:BCL2 like 15 n=1 Tax=Anser cygnoides TaxID=8845 RepID=A0A8B9D7Q6_ANSCY
SLIFSLFLCLLIIYYAIIPYPTLSLLIVLGPVPFAGEPPSDFDPVIIASRLRQIGDQCNMDFERVSSEVLAEVLTGKSGTGGGQILCAGGRL